MDRRPLPKFHTERDGTVRYLPPPDGSATWWGFDIREIYGPAVELAPGLWGPAEVSAWRRWEAFAVGMTIRAVAGRDGRAGRFVCGYLEVRQIEDGPAVTSEALRRVPVAALLRELADALWRQVTTPPKDLEEAWTGGSWTWSLSEDEATRLREQGPVAETLKWVAHSYRVALVLGDPPTRAVEDALKLPRSTAGRWVTMARAEGLLGASEGTGRAGG